jgi:uncharacterized protein (TIGR02996 family)
MIDCLVAACLEDPSAPVHRLALADYLDEHDDPRHRLLRLVPALLAAPVAVRPRVPYVSPEGEPPDGRHRRYPPPPTAWWPPLRPPYPRGRHHLGRLLGVAVVRDCLNLYGRVVPKEAPSFRRLDPFLTRYELYNCKLLTPAVRDGAVRGRLLARPGPDFIRRVTGVRILHSICEAVFFCRAGSFGRCVDVATRMLRCYQDYFASLPYLLSRIKAPPASARVYNEPYLLEAMSYTRVLDLFDAFLTYAP